MIKINLRWLAQALALVFGIVCVTRLFDSSRALFVELSAGSIFNSLMWLVLLGLSLTTLAFTSYLKQRANFTLRHRLFWFERMISLLRLENYAEGGEPRRANVGENSGDQRA